MQISKRCYVIYGLTTIPPWTVNSGLVAGDKKTLIIDCGSNYLSAKTIYGYAKAVKSTNEPVAINTEPHFDHIGGNCFFKEMGVDIYGHSKINRKDEELKKTKEEYGKSILDGLRKKNKEEEIAFYNTKVANPNIGISSDTTIDLGGVTADIILTPGHTKMNLSVYIKEEGILFCGDTIVTGYMPNLDEGDKNNWREWLLSLEKIKSITPGIIVPGHGEIITDNKIETEINRIRSILKSAIDN